MILIDLGNLGSAVAGTIRYATHELRASSIQDHEVAQVGYGVVLDDVRVTYFVTHGSDNVVYAFCNDDLVDQRSWTCISDPVT